MAERSVPIAPVAMGSGAAVQTLLNAAGEPRDYLVIVFQHQAGEFMPCFLVEPREGEDEVSAQQFLEMCAQKLAAHKAGLATPNARTLIVPGKHGD